MAVELLGAGAYGRQHNVVSGVEALVDVLGNVSGDVLGSGSARLPVCDPLVRI